MKTMRYNMNYILLSPENEINEFIKNNENASEILTEIEPLLSRHFPNTAFSLELCNCLEWTNEEKLLVNVLESVLFGKQFIVHFITTQLQCSLSSRYVHPHGIRLIK